MIKKITSFIILISCAFIASYVFAQVPPTNNTDTPIYTNTINQTKSGDISLNNFSVAQNAQFQKKAFIQKTIYGRPQYLGRSTVYIGGTDPSGTTRIVSLDITNGNLITPALSSAAFPLDPWGRPGRLCADSNGVLIKC